VRLSYHLACVIGSVAALAACSAPSNCSGTTYRGDCLVGPDVPATVTPAAASPAQVTPESAVANPVAPAAAGVAFGNPADFADVDDKQCRSYGLTFGSHDYADCRIRLSAQHRGLDPSIGSGNR